jgi:SNF2 family DNA or RNA helicase
MELSFIYGDYRLMSHAESTRTILRKGETLLKFDRDLDAERGYEQHIVSLGFTYEPQINAYLSYANPSMQAAIERWRLFLEEEIPKLEEAGWQIETEENFDYRFDRPDTLLIDTEASGEKHGWFELSFNVQIGGTSIPLLPVITSLLEEFDSIESLPETLNLQLDEGHFLHIRSKEIEPMLQPLFELFERKKGDKLLIAPYDAHLLDFDGMKEEVEWKGEQELRSLAKKLKAFKGIAEAPPSPALKATLRPYQQFGLDWLGFLHEYSFGGILADDMGLGKTVQTLAHLQRLKERGQLTKPSLVVMPTSLIGNWKSEIEKFTPDLSSLALYGLDRAKLFERIGEYDIILTTYQLAQRDVEKYRQIAFDYLILDEAQKIKNPKTKMAAAVKSFHADHRLALSGTPIENHLGELWSIFDFLMPGFLGNLSSFRSLYQKPIEQENDTIKGGFLQRKISPFILRRNKEEVATELPPKTEIIKKAILGPKQAALYESVRVTMEKEVREAIAQKGLARSHITILDALLKLRQVCCHPQLLKLESARSVKESAKLELFLELIDELHAEGKKTLVFSQFTSMLSILEEEIKKRKITYTKLIGSTRKRDEAIAKFTEGEAEIFLISLKAGGVGLNLVQADTVIHYDPWWNPAVENQATDRAYRIGQDKPVFVYKLIVADSIEEQIVALQEKKRSLQESVYRSDKEKEDRLDAGELLGLLEL